MFFNAKGYDSYRQLRASAYVVAAIIHFIRTPPTTPVELGIKLLTISLAAPILYVAEKCAVAKMKDDQECLDQSVDTLDFHS